MDNFVDTHPMRSAFVGNRLQRLVDTISEQGDALLDAQGLKFRAAACSTVLLLHQAGELTTADIGRALGQPHQLVAQRAQALTRQGLIVRVSDSEDGRRKLLVLTEKGRRQAALLEKLLADSAVAFAHLQQQLELDLFAIADQVQAALALQPLSARVAAVRGD